MAPGVDVGRHVGWKGIFSHTALQTSPSSGPPAQQCATKGVGVAVGVGVFVAVAAVLVTVTVGVGVAVGVQKHAQTPFGTSGSHPQPTPQMPNAAHCAGNAAWPHGTGVCVIVGVGVAPVGVGVNVSVGVGVTVFVGVGVTVTVGVAVRVGVGVAPESSASIVTIISP